MAETLSRKKKVRGGHRSTATRIISQAYEVIESATRTESDLITLTQCKRTLEEKLEIIKRADAEILDLVQEDEVETEIEQADVFKERVQRAIIDTNNAIRARERPTASVASSVTTAPERSPISVTTAVTTAPERSSISVTTAETTTPERSTTSVTVTETTMTSTPLLPVIGADSMKVKLPKLSLKKFNGDLTKWSTFWDFFESSMHHNSELSEFNYLNSLLEGASESVSGLKLTSANYTEAIAILRKRFGNKQILTQSPHHITLRDFSTFMIQLSNK